ncbi:MAG: L-serine ammonia-lyase, iron-sulfur-dependent, subunit alpha [Clostridium perfringens]|nr:L-serine ammonia-lyase, iron-sulfur-dependent, subunit alpha [Clostridium perfringens]
MRVAKTGEELLAICKEEGIKLSEYALRCEMQSKNLSKEEVLEKLSKTLEVMKQSSSRGREEEVYSLSGLIGGDAFKLQKYLESGKSFTGNGAILAMAMAISSSEVNASMGKIIACPTAGSCGILPAVMLTAKERLNLKDEELLYGLLAASAIGLIIGKNATFSGAEGGCQAECGSASAMAAGGLVELMGGIPCAKRNASGAVNAICAADLVMAGIESKIPFDDAVSAMAQVGKALPETLRETALGGVAITKTGIMLKKKVFGK